MSVTKAQSLVAMYCPPLLCSLKLYFLKIFIPTLIPIDRYQLVRNSIRTRQSRFVMK